MIRTKRDSLERFIQEQMEGPGACNNQFYCEGDAGTQDGSEEVLNTTPGSIYSTAVLFPQSKLSIQKRLQKSIRDQYQNLNLRLIPTFRIFRMITRTKIWRNGLID